MLHVAQEDLPFGGVGQSGTGAYHGHDGFLRFSHKRAVFTQSKLDVAKIAGLRPPYGRKLDKLIGRTIRK
jgi:coniferyl-aldehyde dehydrogenase